MAKDNRLLGLRGSGYEIAAEEPDILGWPVRNPRGHIMGVVDDLLFDRQSSKVRYLVLNIKGKALNLVSRKVLIPIGLAELHEESDEVILPDITVGHLASLPAYNKNRFTPVMERKVRNAFAGTEMAGIDDDMAVNEDDFYDNEYFDENRIYSKRGSKPADETAVETGGARIKKSIIKEPVRDKEHFKNQLVTDERDAVNKPVQNGSFAPFQEGTIELTEYAEVPVVTKEAKVVEEITVGKEVRFHDETVRDTVRKTEVKVEKLNKENLSKERDSRDI